MTTKSDNAIIIQYWCVTVLVFEPVSFKDLSDKKDTFL